MSSVFTARPTTCAVIFAVAQFCGGGAEIRLAVVGVVMDQQQRAGARVSGKGFCRFAQGERQRPSPARAELFERRDHFADVEGLRLAHDLHVRTIAAPVPEHGKADARLRRKLAEAAAQRLARQHQLGLPRPFHGRPHGARSVDDDEKRSRLGAGGLVAHGYRKQGQGRDGSRGNGNGSASANPLEQGWSAPAAIVLALKLV